MGRDPLQHIDQVVVGIDPLQAAGGDQALHDADVVGPQLGPAKQPAAPPHGNRAQGPLDRIIPRHGLFRVTVQRCDFAADRGSMARPVAA